MRDFVDRKSNALASLIVASFALTCAWVPPAAGEQDPIATERSLMDVIQSTRVQAREQAAGEPEKRRWAILPEIGLSPEKGANGGIKFTDRDRAEPHGRHSVDSGAGA